MYPRVQAIRNCCISVGIHKGEKFRLAGLLKKSLEVFLGTDH